MTRTRSIRLPDLAATRRFGAGLAECLAAGDTVLLEGDLGSGKTTLARAVIARLCGVEDAPSPTYTIVQAYDCVTGGELWHADLYRIEHESELEELGLDDAFDRAICLIEWPDRLGRIRPADRLEIELSAVPGLESGREARITGFGRWENRIDDV
jgi:tRNA threonylcarbamoyl adenosine modification protein YjeE